MRIFPSLSIARNAAVAVSLVLTVAPALPALPCVAAGARQAAHETRAAATRTPGAADMLNRQSRELRKEVGDFRAA
ncbi:MAG TPA: hypothetical protein VEI03_12035 [Stellaceae bacterium]|nr:hypothetical protein [Stellaceae bacterium]